MKFIWHGSNIWTMCCELGTLSTVLEPCVFTTWNAFWLFLSLKVYLYFRIFARMYVYALKSDTFNDNFFTVYFHGGKVTEKDLKVLKNQQFFSLR